MRCIIRYCSATLCYMYDLQADNRQVRRAMEKENKKERDAARKEYNQNIRVCYYNYDQ